MCMNTSIKIYVCVYIYKYTCTYTILAGWRVHIQCPSHISTLEDTLMKNHAVNPRTVGDVAPIFHANKILDGNK